MSVEQALATPITLHIAGRERSLAPLTLGDLGRFRQWVRSRLIADAREYLEGDALTRFISETLRADIDIETHLQTPEGIAYLLYLSVAHSDSSVKPDEMLDGVTLADTGQLSGYMEALMPGMRGDAEVDDDPKNSGE